MNKQLAWKKSAFQHSIIAPHTFNLYNPYTHRDIKSTSSVLCSYFLVGRRDLPEFPSVAMAASTGLNQNVFLAFEVLSDIFFFFFF